MIVVGLVLIGKNFTCYNDWTIHRKGYKPVLNQAGTARCRRNGDVSLIIGIVLFLGGLGIMIWCSIKYKPSKRNVSRNRDKKKTNPDNHSGIVATGNCSTQNKDASDTITPGKQYYVSYCSITNPPSDASGNLLGHWYCVSFGNDNDVKGRSAYYIPQSIKASCPEMLKMNLCDYYCNGYGSSDVDPAKFQSCLVTSDRPFGYGEYSVWMKNSIVGGVMSCFYLSKQYSIGADNQITSNGQMELDWEVTANPDDPNNSILCDTNIYSYDPMTDPNRKRDNRCDDIPTCQQPDDFRADFKGGFPTTSTSYEGALQYIIGVYPDKIQFKLVNADYKLLYFRTIDKEQKTDTAIQYDSAGNVIRKKDFPNTNFEQINKLYTDETTLYPFLNTWTPTPLNWLTDFYNQTNVLYDPKNADQSGLCNNCDGPDRPNRVMDVPGSTSIVFGPFIFTPDPSNKVFKPSDWLAYNS